MLSIILGVGYGFICIGIWVYGVIRIISLIPTLTPEAEKLYTTEPMFSAYWNCSTIMSVIFFAILLLICDIILFAIFYGFPPLAPLGVYLGYKTTDILCNKIESCQEESKH